MAVGQPGIPAAVLPFARAARLDRDLQANLWTVLLEILPILSEFERTHLLYVVGRTSLLSRLASHWHAQSLNSPAIVSVHPDSFLALFSCSLRQAATLSGTLVSHPVASLRSTTE